MSVGASSKRLSVIVSLSAGTPQPKHRAGCPSASRLSATRPCFVAASAADRFVSTIRCRAHPNPSAVAEQRANPHWHTASHCDRDGEEHAGVGSPILPRITRMSRINDDRVPLRACSISSPRSAAALSEPMYNSEKRQRNSTLMSRRLLASCCFLGCLLGFGFLAALAASARSSSRRWHICARFDVADGGAS